MKFSLGLVLISSVILGCSGNAVESRTPALIQSAAKGQYIQNQLIVPSEDVQLSGLQLACLFQKSKE